MRGGRGHLVGEGVQDIQRDRGSRMGAVSSQRFPLDLTEGRARRLASFFTSEVVREPGCRGRAPLAFSRSQRR